MNVQSPLHFCEAMHILVWESLGEPCERPSFTNKIILYQMQKESMNYKTKWMDIQKLLSLSFNRQTDDQHVNVKEHQTNITYVKHVQRTLFLIEEYLAKTHRIIRIYQL